MPPPDVHRLGRVIARERGLPSERDWERSEVLEPRPASRVPQLISDGGGLPFSPEVLSGPFQELDTADPAVGALLEALGAGTSPKRPSRLPWRREVEAAPSPPLPRLDEWRSLARTEDEALFGRGRPPRLLTVAVRQDRRRGRWMCVAKSAARPLRATRDGIRASSWRLDPSHEVEAEDRVLRILLTEQTFAGGRKAGGRVLNPDIHVNESELVLTMFVTPQPGFQMKSPNPETPVRIALPDPVSARRLIDGALYDADY
jgi:hypothetical protein